jgi:hypothetical protein
MHFSIFSEFLALHFHPLPQLLRTERQWQSNRRPATAPLPMEDEDADLDDGGEAFALHHAATSNRKESRCSLRLSPITFLFL